MASNIKKAGSAIKKSFRSRRYAMMEIDENNYVDASPRFRKVGNAATAGTKPTSTSRDEEQTHVATDPAPQNANETFSNRSILKRGASVTQSMRDAVGTIREKFRTSTRRLTRLQNQSTPTRVGKRRNTLGPRDVKMSSPFMIETPKRTSGGSKACLSLETPTRLRREVEALTSNMQALSALTPNTLQARAKARRAPPPPITAKASPRAPPRTRRRSIMTEIQ